MMWGTSTLRTLANEDLGTLADNDPLTDRAFNVSMKYIGKGTGQKDRKASRALTKFLIFVMEVSGYLGHEHRPLSHGQQVQGLCGCEFAV